MLNKKMLSAVYAKKQAMLTLDVTLVNAQKTVIVTVFLKNGNSVDIPPKTKKVFLNAEVSYLQYTNATQPSHIVNLQKTGSTFAYTKMSIIDITKDAFLTI